MSLYYKYKKEKFLEKYKSAYNILEDLKYTITEYKSNKNRINKTAMLDLTNLHIYGC